MAAASLRDPLSLRSGPHRTAGTQQDGEAPCKQNGEGRILSRFLQMKKWGFFKEQWHDPSHCFQVAEQEEASEEQMLAALFVPHSKNLVCCYSVFTLKMSGTQGCTSFPDRFFL